MICDYCGTMVEDDNLNEITLYGEDDFYNIEVCKECQDRFCDSFSPEETDN